MIFGDRNRDQLRNSYVIAWRKFRAGEPLAPLDQQLAAVIAEHPEYHALLEHDPRVLGAEFTPELGQQNPFLHLGLHLAIREQVATDRPAGIAAVYTTLAQRLGSSLEAEHRMFEALGEALWQAQRTGSMPDEARYLDRLRQLAGMRAF
jgi:cell fate (sporulation/competence/biofilm development) regulator YlbF (YheA/YmcA/DUF963 family)